MDRFTLKSWSIGFEVPFFKNSLQEGIESLSPQLSQQYKNWSDMLRSEFIFFQLPSQNVLILLTLVIRVDSDLVNSDTFKSEWDEVTASITKIIEDYLKSSKISYRTLKEYE